MPDIIQEAWKSADECTLLAQETNSREMRRFFLNLASSWKKVALNYEVLAQNDRYLIELKRTNEAQSVACPAEVRCNKRDPVRPEITPRFVVGLFWRRA
jgi:hypothetical protein